MLQGTGEEQEARLFGLQEWADGRAEFDVDATFARMTEALNSALAADAGHADILIPDTSAEGRP